MSDEENNKEKIAYRSYESIEYQVFNKGLERSDADYQRVFDEGGIVGYKVNGENQTVIVFHVRCLNNEGQYEYLMKSFYTARNRCDKKTKFLYVGKFFNDELEDELVCHLVASLNSCDKNDVYLKHDVIDKLSICYARKDFYKRHFGIDVGVEETTNSSGSEKPLATTNSSAYEKPFAATSSRRFRKLEERIKSWLERTTYSQFCEAIKQRVIGQPNLKLILANIYRYMNNIADGHIPGNTSMLLAAPSGCGKTETYRAIRDYFKNEILGFEVDFVDLNRVTSEGFKGEDTKYLVKRVIDTGGIGIVFLDEFDKKLLPAHSSGGENVNEEIQGQILTVIEGSIFEVNNQTVDTRRTLFIGLGSFNHVRTERESEKHFGYVKGNKEKISHYSDITRDDMIRMGALHELIGRFGLIVNYQPLTRESINKIIDLRAEEISHDFGFPVRISDSMREYLYDNSQTEYGNRLIDSIVREVVLKAYIEIVENDIESPQVTVTGIDSYKIFRGKNSEFENTN